MEGTILEGTAPLAGSQLALEASPYPYRGYTRIALAASQADGSYDFAPVRLSRNTRLRVSAPQAASPTLQAFVDPRVTLASRSLGPGRDLLSIRLAHAYGVRTATADAYFYAAPAGSNSYRLIVTAPTSELKGATTFASATIDPPSKRFRYRICVSPPWEAAMGPARAHGACPTHGFRLVDAI